jgi:phosphatidylserine decarboxylase
MKFGWTNEMTVPMTAAVALLALGSVLCGGWLSRSGWLRGAGLALALLAFSLCLLFLIFFRDPERTSQAAANKILSPADGRVMVVEVLQENKVLQSQAQRVAIFMNVANVHVQRMPASARLLRTDYQPGKFLPAFISRAGFENEQRWYAFDHAGQKYAVVQIAGLLARRIHCWIKPDATYERGARFGMISLGSEVDVYLPLSAQVAVKPGDVVRAGETVLGEWGEP